MSIKLLVADDSITIQKVIGIIFGGEEYSLTVVDNGKTALEKAREIVPDVLLIDALMPGMSGYEVAEAIRATPALATKPILILTGSFEPFDEDKAKRCGADDFLAKPFESQQIVAKVKELAELGSTRSQISSAASFPPASDSDSAAVFDSFVAAAPALEETNPPAVPAFQTDTAAQTQEPADIWGAFTPQAEPVAAPATEIITFEPADNTDVFALVDAATKSQSEQPDSSTQHTGSQWIPVEENTFEFKEEVVSKIQPPHSEPAEELQESEFGDVTFASDTMPTVTPVSTADAEQEDAMLQQSTASAAPGPLTADDVVAVSAAVPVMLTEDQLKAAISAVSSDVIERIVWEVVPDLAEALIKEAIRRIKEGL